MTEKADKRRIVWEAVRQCEDELIFDAAATSELRMAMGLPLSASWADEDLQSALNELALRFAIDRYEETNPDEPASVAQALRLGKACRSILKDLGASADGGMIDPGFGKFGLFRIARARGEASGEAATMHTVRAIRLLADDAFALATVSAKRRLGRPHRHGPREEKAIKQLIAGLSDLYFRAWGKLPGIGRNPDTHIVTGPFAALLLGVHKKLHARGLDTMVRQPDALAQVWNRLSDEDKLNDVKRIAESWQSAMDELK